MQLLVGKVMLAHSISRAFHFHPKPLHCEVATLQGIVMPCGGPFGEIGTVGKNEKLGPKTLNAFSGRLAKRLEDLNQLSDLDCNGARLRQFGEAVQEMAGETKKGAYQRIISHPALDNTEHSRRLALRCIHGAFISMKDREILQLQRCRICSDWKAGLDQQNWVALLGIEGEVAGKVVIRAVNRGVHDTSSGMEFDRHLHNLARPMSGLGESRKLTGRPGCGGFFVRCCGGVKRRCQDSRA